MRRAYLGDIETSVREFVSQVGPPATQCMAACHERCGEHRRFVNGSFDRCGQMAGHIGYVLQVGREAPTPRGGFPLEWCPSVYCDIGKFTRAQYSKAVMGFDVESLVFTHACISLLWVYSSEFSWAITCTCASRAFVGRCRLHGH